MENEVTFPIEEFNFRTIELEEVQSALQKNLLDHFGDVNVEIVNCPDFSVPPFNLATKGFGDGVTGILDLGGVPYLIPLAHKSKIYDLRNVTSKYIGCKDFPNGFYISGAGAGPWPSQGSNCEMIINMLIDKNGVMLQNKSRVALTTKSGTSDSNVVILRDLEEEESRCALLANVMVSSGRPGKVLRIKCTKRIDPLTNLTASIRSSLSKEFGTEAIGLGGLFIVQNSPTKIHIMQDFSSNPLLTDEDVNNWLRFFDMDPPMLFQSILVSSDPGLDLRVEHSHGWSLCGKAEGGHYHYDMSPDTVEYVAYYAVASKLWRIDRPPKTHLIGRD